MSGDKGREPLPLPEVISEWEMLEEELHELIGKTQDGKGETVRMMVELPKEWAILAAWLELIRTRHPEPVGRPVSTSNADRSRVRRYVWRALNERFHHEFHWLATRGHWALFEPEEKPEKNLSDEDLPF